MFVQFLEVRPKFCGDLYLKGEPLSPPPPVLWNLQIAQYS